MLPEITAQLDASNKLEFHSLANKLSGKNNYSITKGLKVNLWFSIFVLRGLRILAFPALPACGLDGCGANIPIIVHIHSSIPSKESASGKRGIGSWRSNK